MDGQAHRVVGGAQRRLHARDFAQRAARSLPSAREAIDRIAAIHAAIPNTHLVMHGSSSVPQEWLSIIRQFGGEIKQTYGVPVEEIVRGIRSPTDYDYETQMSGMNRHLAPEVDTVFLHTSAAVQHISSTLVREIHKLGGDVSGLVSAPVMAALKASA